MRLFLWILCAVLHLTTIVAPPNVFYFAENDLGSLATGTNNLLTKANEALAKLASETPIREFGTSLRLPPDYKITRNSLNKYNPLIYNEIASLVGKENVEGRQWGDVRRHLIEARNHLENLLEWFLTKHRDVEAVRAQDSNVVTDIENNVFRNPNDEPLLTIVARARDSHEGGPRPIHNLRAVQDNRQRVRNLLGTDQAENFIAGLGRQGWVSLTVNDPYTQRAIEKLHSDSLTIRRASYIRER
ncbi:hypothetical protein ACQY0O_000549 [Thecaphora frezii]